MVKVDLSGTSTFFDPAELDFAAAAEAHRALTDKTGAGSEFTGWTELPERIRDGELKAILSAAQRIRGRSKALVVIGIGGSYLGARGAIELLRPIPSEDDPKIFFVGNGLSPDALNDTLAQLGDMDFDINVISKSGTTLEPALAFRIFRQLARQKYGNAAKKHIFATTDSKRGALKSLADAEGWECFVVPDDVGGRYSVLSAVGLLPMAVAGINIKEVITSAICAFKQLDLRSPENPAWQYAAARQYLYAHGRSIEILGCYEPSFRFMAEWWKQLYGESEGKNGIGIFPASVEFTADLHSMGQYIQDGPRSLMETIVSFDSPRSSVSVPFEMGDPDGLNYLAGKSYADICRTVAQAVRSAHISGGVPNIGISVTERNEAGLADLICFFELACAISGYMSGVNPFDQPGVEAYKKNMFKMLGKPGT
jgi:glucose-6-phosphate isomerase